MNFKKISAAAAALTLCASMVVSASASTEIPVKDAKTDAWSNCFQSYENEDGESSDDYLDARTFTKDKDLTVTVDFEWTDMGKMVDNYVLIGPGTTHESWLKFGDPSLDKIETDFPQANHLKAGYSMDGEAVVKGDKTEPVFLKKDGFIQVNDQNITSVTFTIPKDYVNKMIETANQEESWDGIIFQVKNMKVTKVTTDQDGVMLASEYLANGGKKEDTSSEAPAEESSSEAPAEEPSSETPTEEPSSETPVETPTDSSSTAETNPGTGASTGIALAGIALAGAAIVISRKRK